MKNQKIKTQFADVQTILADMSNYLTLQDNEVNCYARVCIRDEFSRDYYKIMKDFAIYYDKVDSFRISIADSTLVETTCFKSTHCKTEKTRALEFSVKSDELRAIVYEILAQRLVLTNQFAELSFNIKTTVVRRQKKERKAN